MRFPLTLAGKAVHVLLCLQLRSRSLHHLGEMRIGAVAAGLGYFLNLQKCLPSLKRGICEPRVCRHVIAFRLEEPTSMQRVEIYQEHDWNKYFLHQ